MTEDDRDRDLPDLLDLPAHNLRDLSNLYLPDLPELDAWLNVLAAADQFARLADLLDGEWSASPNALAAVDGFTRAAAGLLAGALDGLTDLLGHDTTDALFVALLADAPRPRLVMLLGALLDANHLDHLLDAAHRERS